MRLGLSHLANHKFRHNFQDCLNPICSCGQEIETTEVIDYCIIPSISHLHIFNFMLATKQILSSLVCFPIINILICYHSLLLTFSL